MEISEISDARDLRVALLSGTGRGTWAWWAPGDATRYRVAYVHPAAYDSVEVPFQRLLLVVVGDRTLALPCWPRKLWTPELFLRTFGDEYAGWWAAIRPILAAFAWTSTRPKDFTYSPDDAVEISQFMAEVT
jgi:hypothetical protein